MRVRAFSFRSLLQSFHLRTVSLGLWANNSTEDVTIGLFQPIESLLSIFEAAWNRPPSFFKTLKARIIPDRRLTRQFSYFGSRCGGLRMEIPDFETIRRVRKEAEAARAYSRKVCASILRLERLV